MGVGCLVLAGLGLLLADAWYSDDACPIEEWKCAWGGRGLGAFLFGILIGSPILVCSLAIAWFSPGRERFLNVAALLLTLGGVGMIVWRLTDSVPEDFMAPVAAAMLSLAAVSWARAASDRARTDAPSLPQE